MNPYGVLKQFKSNSQGDALGYDQEPLQGSFIGCYISQGVAMGYVKGRRGNNFTEFATRFGSDFAATIERNRRNSLSYFEVSRLRSSERCPEDGKRKCEVISAPTLRPLAWGQDGPFMTHYDVGGTPHKR